MSGLKSYDNGTKNTWRGWVWNRIVERLDKDPSEATAIYLVGPEDRDRDAAIAKGFRNENLIAVDLDPENVRRVRERGGFAICADLVDVVRHWNDKPVDVLIADFCGGLTRPAHALCNTLVFGATAICKGSTVVVNLEAGREAGLNRDILLAAKRVSEICSNVPSGHRAALWAQQAAMVYGANFRPSSMERDRAFLVLVNAMNAMCQSYISKVGGSKLRFDTAVLTWPMPTYADFGCESPYNATIQVKRDLAALKATRTRLANDAQRRYWERRRHLEVAKG